MRETSATLPLLGLLIGMAVVGGSHMAMGGSLTIFVQLEALAIVFGGTAAALLVSFTGPTLYGAVTGVRELFNRRDVPLETLVPTFITFARTARRHGLAAVEREIDSTGDAFFARALSMALTGLSPQVVREALEIDARVLAEREEERAHVLEAAAGYAPTLGIVGAVLGLMRVMQVFGTGNVGSGIAAAFVATVFGVGAANLVFLPLATRLRSRARQDQLRRDLVIDGVLALRDGASPGVLEERLAGYLTLNRPSAQARAEVA